MCMLALGAHAGFHALADGVQAGPGRVQARLQRRAEAAQRPLGRQLRQHAQRRVTAVYQRRQRVQRVLRT